MRNFCNCNNKLKFLGTKNNFKIKYCISCGNAFVVDKVDMNFLENFYDNARNDNTFEKDLREQDFPRAEN